MRYFPTFHTFHTLHTLPLSLHIKKLTIVKINVLSVNTSENKGTVKKAVPSITLTRNGIEGDAHSGPWHRQVSLLGIESVRKFEKLAKRKIEFGEFAENITTEGLELFHCKPLDRFVGEDFYLEVTQIGKKCHGDSCAIYREVGNCVMPKEGIFARVKAMGDGRWAMGDEDQSSKREALNGLCESHKRETQSAKPEAHHILTPGTKLTYIPKQFTTRIITLSDRAYAGTYEDRSGPRIGEILEEFLPNMEHRPSPIAHRTSPIAYTLLPDDPTQLQATLKQAIDANTDFIFTTGGTGIGPRDFTPDVVKPLLDKEIPGLMELIRVKYGMEKPNALISRSIAGVAGNSLVFCLPGSVKAINEYMAEILKSLKHMVYMLHGLDAH